MTKKTLVLGASANRARYSNRAIHQLRNQNIEVETLGLKKETVADILIDTTPNLYKNIHTVTLYLNPKRQKEYYNYVLTLKPKRVIFNPGTENEEFERLLQENGIATETSCTLVLLSTGQY